MTGSRRTRARSRAAGQARRLARSAPAPAGPGRGGRRRDPRRGSGGAARDRHGRAGRGRRCARSGYSARAGPAPSMATRPRARGSRRRPGCRPEIAAWRGGPRPPGSSPRASMLVRACGLFSPPWGNNPHRIVHYRPVRRRFRPCGSRSERFLPPTVCNIAFSHCGEAGFPHMMPTLLCTDAGTTALAKTSCSNTASSASRSTNVTFASAASRRRASSASSSGSVEEDEAEDLINLVVNGEVTDPASALGEHVNDCWPELVGPVRALARALAAAADLPQRVARPAGQGGRAGRRLRRGRQRASSTSSRDRGGEPIELAPEPSWNRVAYVRR